jgi:hypothetical protein
MTDTEEKMKTYRGKKKTYLPGFSFWRTINNEISSFAFLRTSRGESKNKNWGDSP